MNQIGSPPKAAPTTYTAAAVPVVQGVVAMTAMDEKQQQNTSSSGGGSSNVIMMMKTKIPMIDMTAHNGLRGVCALWVVLAHCLGSYVAMNASSIMPLFFMLSGFSLTAMYGRTEWALPCSSSSSSSSSFVSSICCLFSSCSSASSTDSPPLPSSSSVDVPAALEEGTLPSLPPSLPPFTTRRFYQNRFARVLPIYWLCILLSLPLTFLGLERSPFSLPTFLPSLFTSLLPSATLLSFLGWDTSFYVLNGPGWFVCTLLWFWIAFPLFLPHAQRLSSPQLRSNIVFYFYLQLVLMLGVYALVNETRGHGPPAFNTAAKNPLVRFPLFLMGMCAGLLALRHPLPPSLPPSLLPHEAATPPMDMSPVKTPRKGRVAGNDRALLSSLPPSLDGAEQARVTAAAGGGVGGGGAAENSNDNNGKEEGEQQEERMEEAWEGIDLNQQHQSSSPHISKGGVDLTQQATNPPRVSISVSHAAKALMADEQPPSESEDLMPWPASFFGFPLPAFLLKHLPSLPPSLSIFSLDPHTPSWWSRKATREGIALCALTLLIGTGESIVVALSPTHTGFQATLWWQALVPFAQLNILVALTREGGRADGKVGLAKQALMTPVVQWLGKISMTLYLSHMSVIRYAALAAHPRVLSTLWHCLFEGKEGLEGGRDAAMCSQAQAEAKVMPVWATAIVVPVSLLLAEGLYRFVEVPARQALRAK